MKLDPINLIGGFYQDDNLPWSAQDTVNWIPRPAEMPGTISQLKLAGAPGLSFLTDIDDEPVRIGGFRNVEGRMFIVAGTTLYELNTDLTTTVRGTIPGAGPVTMAHNQLEFGNELSIGNGSDTLYVWNTWTNTFTVVTDDAATGSVQSVYLNRRIIHLDPFGRFGYPSDIDNATSYDSLDRFDSEASPDKFVGLGVSQFELVGISQRTTEFYSDTGATEQPFRPKRIAINRGCAARNSIVQLGGTLAMLGDDGIFYRLQGYQWEPISTGPVNKAIEGNNWANCFGFVYEDRKHEIAYWTFPDGQTWGYDAWTGLIHRRESFGLNRWRINAVEKWNDMWIAGDFQSGRIYRIDWDTYHEYGQPLVSRRVAPPIYNNGNKIVCPMIELVFDTGRGGPQPLGLTGDLPDGLANFTSGTMQYEATGGIGPYTFSIVAGALPAGASMDTDGLVTYAYTTLGLYEWTVRVTDSFGNQFDLQDSAEVGMISWDNTWTFVANSGLSGAATSKVEWSPTLGIAVYTEGNPVQTVPDYTTNGTAWLNGSPDLTDRFAVAWSPALNMFAGGRDGNGSNRSASSVDGINWTLGSISGDFYGAQVMCWAPDLAQFLGYGGGAGGASTGWRKSTDGINWTTGVVGPTGPGDARVLVRGAGVYVALSATAEPVSRRIMWSANGETDWTDVGTFDTGFVDCKWVPEKNLFIAVGSTGVIAQRFVVTSPDGKVWTDVTPAGLSTDPYGVEYSPELGKFVLTMSTSTMTPVTFYTCVTPSSGGWTAHAGLFPGGNFKSLKWLGAPIYRFVVISNTGAQGNGAAYSNSILVTP